MSSFRRHIMMSFYENTTPTYNPEWSVSDLFDGWRNSSSYPSSVYNTYRCFESNSNYNVGGKYSKITISFKGIPDFHIYINSYAETSYDYTIAFNIDTSWTSSSLPTSTSTGVKAHTSGKQYSPTGTLSTNWTRVDYSNDGGEHFVEVVYRKDGSANNNNDRGYILVPKNGDNNICPPNNEVWYYASSKMSSLGSSLGTGETIQQHEFSNGRGVLRCSIGISTINSSYFLAKNVSSLMYEVRFPETLANAGSSTLGSQNNLNSVYFFSRDGLTIGSGFVTDCPYLESIKIFNATSLSVSSGTSRAAGSFSNAALDYLDQGVGCSLYISNSSIIANLLNNYTEVPYETGGGEYHGLRHYVYSQPSYSSGTTYAGMTSAQVY